MSTKKKLFQAAAGAAGGAGLDVDEVFSVDLFEDTSHNYPKTVTNGIDFAGEGGLRIAKRRDASSGWVWTDTTMNSLEVLRSSSSNGIDTNEFDAVNTFNSDGFTTGNLSGNNIPWANWSFRKARKFFDVVTYTGTGANRTISHNLGSDVGFMAIKRTNTTGSWACFHRSLNTTSGEKLNLNSTNASSTNTGFFNSTAPTSTEFTVGTSNNTNASGGTYVAYLFAHNDGDGEFGPDADQDIIKCGSYTGNGSSTGPEVNLGFEPQLLIVKASSTTGNWRIFDSMRGFGQITRDGIFLNSANAEDTTSPLIMEATATGFRPRDTNAQFNGSGQTYIYMAIRRGPLAEPESATDVFDVNEATNPRGFVTTGFPVDLHMQRKTESGDGFNLADRLRGERKFLYTTETSSEYTFSSSFPAEFDHMNGIDNYSYSSQTKDTIFYNWKRAPNYFDVVAYTGDGTAGKTVDHNLGVEPEMIWVKARSSGSSESWNCYFKTLGNTYVLFLNKTFQALANSNYWNSTTPTATQFTLGNYNGTNKNATDYIAYLFASLAGISKVGSVSHTNGTDTNVDCGFSSGARFILLKRTDGASSWYVWDSERGIVAGNDPVLYLQSTLAEQTGDSVDPLSSGFTMVGGSFDTGTYIFYAIA